MSLVASLLATAAGAAISYGLKRHEQKRAQRYNEQQADKAYSLSTPSNQVQELKNANLNPNLVYGSIQPASYAGQTTSPVDQEIDFLKPMISHWAREEQKLSMEAKRLGNERTALENEYLRQSMPDRLSQQSSLAQRGEQQIILNQLDGALKAARTKLTNKQYDHLEASIQKMIQDVELGQVKIDLTKLEVAEKQLTNDLNKRLKPYGITVEDRSLVGLIARFLFLGYGRLEQLGGLESLKHGFEAIINKQHPIEFHYDDVLPDGFINNK